MEKTIQTKQWEVSEVELSYKSKGKASERPKVNSSRLAYEVLISSWDDGKLELIEQFKVLYTNRHHKVLAIMEVSTGGMAGTVIDAKIIFIGALKVAAHGIILAHNHPSGNCRPSATDIQQTRKLQEAGEVLDIKILDHLIVSREEYYSFRDEGSMS